MQVDDVTDDSTFHRLAGKLKNICVCTAATTLLRDPACTFAMACFEGLTPDKIVAYCCELDAANPQCMMDVCQWLLPTDPVALYDWITTENTGDDAYFNEKSQADYDAAVANADMQLTQMNAVEFVRFQNKIYDPSADGMIRVLDYQ